MSFKDIRFSNYPVAGISTCFATVFTNPLEVNLSLIALKRMFIDFMVNPLVGCQNSVAASRWTEKTRSDTENVSRCFTYIVSNCTIWWNISFAKRSRTITRIKILPKFSTVKLCVVFHVQWKCKEWFVETTKYSDLFQVGHFWYSNNTWLDEK